MPKILRRNLPGQLYKHLLERVQQRQISGNQLTLMVNWLDTRRRFRREMVKPKNSSSTTDEHR